MFRLALYQALFTLFRASIALRFFAHFALLRLVVPSTNE